LGLTTIIVNRPSIARRQTRGGREDSGSRQSRCGARRQTGTTHVEWVADSAGRLQGKDYLQHYSIQRRAELELTEHGILIRPLNSR
jgi:hypothetical protein